MTSVNELLTPLSVDLNDPPSPPKWASTEKVICIREKAIYAD